MNRKQQVLVIATIMMISSWLAAAVYFSMIEEKMDEGKVKIVASFYPLGYFARRIGGEHVTVRTLIPENTEVHGWQPSISDILEADEADVILYHGLDLDSWFEDEILPELSTSGKVIMKTTQDVETTAAELHIMKKIFEVWETAPTNVSTANGTPFVDEGVHYNVILNGSDGNYTGTVLFDAPVDSPYVIATHPWNNTDVTVSDLNGSEVSVDSIEFGITGTIWTFELNESQQYKVILTSGVEALDFTIVEHEWHEGDAHFHDLDDPHTWISPHTALGLAQNVYSALVEADPDRESYYFDRMIDLTDEFEQLDDDYWTALSTGEVDTIIVSHTAFGYLADRYGFEQHGVIGMSADEQPSTSTLISIIELMDEEGIYTMYVDPMYSDDHITTLENDVEARMGSDVRILKLYTMLGKVDGKDYFEQMEANLESLKAGLGVT